MGFTWRYGWASTRTSSHTELVVTTEGKTDCKQWNSDDWGGYQRVLPPEMLHYIGSYKTQRLERTNSIVRQQTGRWHRRQNKFGYVWEQFDCDNPIGGELFQLDLAAQSHQFNCGSACGVDN